MDEEKECRKNRRRSIRTLRRQSGVLPLNLLATDNAPESTSAEGKVNEEDQATFGSIWFESQEPVKERRKRRSNIFASLPLFTKTPSSDADCDLTGNLEIRSDNVKALEYSKNDLENSIIHNTDTECPTPSVDKENINVSYGSCNNQTSPEQDISNISPSSMSPDFPMSPSVAMYSALMHDKSYSGPNADSINVPDISDQEQTTHEGNDMDNETMVKSLSDKENNPVLNNSNVGASISPLTEKEYTADVSPGFLHVAKSFAGKVMNFVRTSPSYLANTFLNTSDNSNISASPALKDRASISSIVDEIIDGDSPAIEDEKVKHLVNIDLNTELKSSVVENMDVIKLDNCNKSHVLGLTGSARKKRDRTTFFDTFAAITEELMKDTEVNKPINSHDNCKTVEQRMDCEDEKELKQLCDKVQEDEVGEHYKELVTPLPEISDSDICGENHENICVDSDKKIKPKDGLNVTESISEQSETDKQVDSVKNNVTDTQQSTEKNESPIRETMDTPELTGTEYYDCSKSSDRNSSKRRKRRALDVAYSSRNDDYTYEGKNEKSENNLLDDNIDRKCELPPRKSFEETTMTGLLIAEAAVHNKCSNNYVNSSPKLSLIKVLSNEQNTCISENSPDDISVEPDSCQKKGRRRAFGFFSADESKLRAGKENGCPVNEVRDPCNTLNTKNEDSDKDVEKNATGSEGAEVTRMKSALADENMMGDKIVNTNNEDSDKDVGNNATGSEVSEVTRMKFASANENVIGDKIDDSVETLIDTNRGEDLKIQKKPKNSRRRSGKFNIVPKYNKTYDANEVNGAHLLCDVVNECERPTDTKFSILPVSQKSTELDCFSHTKLGSENDSTIISSISSKVPKKRGRPKKCFNAHPLKLAEVKECNEAEAVKTDVNIKNPERRVNECFKQTITSSEINIEKNVGDKEISLNEVNIGTSEPNKNVEKNATGSEGAEVTRMKSALANENMIGDKIDDSEETLIDTNRGEDLKIQKKPKNSRRRSGKFNIVPKYNKTYDANEVNGAHSLCDVVNECERPTDTKFSILPVSQKSTELDCFSHTKLGSENDSTIISSISSEVPKKRGRPKKCFNANLLKLAEVKECNEAEAVKTDVNIKDPKHRVNECIKQTITSSEINIEKNIGDKEISLNEVKIGTSEPKKRGRRKSADAAALNIKKLEHYESDTKDKETDNNIVVPKKRWHRKSADAAAFNIKKLEHFESDAKDKEIDNKIVVPKKRGRRKSADVTSLGIKKCEINKTKDIDNDFGNETNVQKKRGHRKSAEIASLSIKKTVVMEGENTDNEFNIVNAVQKKRGRRRSADIATLKVQMINNDDILDDAGDNKRGRKRKLETSEDIEKLYRNKNYTKPEEKKPWQTIVESPHNPTEVYKKQRLQRCVDFENPSQLKLRRRFQKAIKNGWDHKMKNIGELDDEFVREKLANVWSELDDETKAEDLRSKLQSIVETV